MFWANLLHFYQPYNQQDDILDRIVHESYMPIIEGLLKRKNSKTIINISGCLTKLLYDKGYADLLDKIRQLGEDGQFEFTESAIYHAILPLLPEEEIVRQINLNHELNLKYLGSSYKPVGFFPPELAVNDKVLKVVSKLGYKWIASAQVSYPSGIPDQTTLYREESTGMNIFFRNKRVSSLILSAVVRNSADLMHETQDIQKEDSYWFTVMDAETFGHHRIGHEKLLFDILDSGDITSVTTENLFSQKYKTQTTAIRPSTWTNEEQDFWLDKEKKIPDEGRSFILWKDPENPIHKLQWEFVNFNLAILKNYENKGAVEWKKAREMLDVALASDQFWWASAKPWWSLEMIEQGAFSLKEVALEFKSKLEYKHRAEDIYRHILEQAFDWQRSGYIRKKHLQNSATFMKKPFSQRAPAEWHNQMILEFEDEMKRAANNMDYEKAIKWRDAITKIKNGTDIYDVLHVVDELWTARNIPSVKPFSKHSWGEFSSFAKDNFKSIKDEKDFERQKNLVS